MARRPPAATLPGSVIDGAWESYSVVQQGGTALTLSMATVFRDGQPLVTGPVYVASLVLRASNLLGRSNLAVNTYLGADQAEIRFYNRALDPCEQGQVEAELAARWGL
jgi:hypothetical protein